MARWLLYVDESGNFDSSEKTVCLGGLLVQYDRVQRLTISLRSGIEKIYPHVPYPPHASELNLFSGHLAAWRRRPGPSVYADRLEAANRELESALKTQGGNGALQGFLYPAGRQGRPEYEDLQVCDAWMARHAPAALRLLEQVLEDSREKMQKFLSFARSSLVKLGQGCVLMGVVECDPEEWDGQGAARDRYLRLLRTLLEEVFLVLRSQPGAGNHAQVQAQIASRDIFDATRKLTTDDVREVARCAAAFPLYPPAAGLDTVGIEPEVVPKYDGNTHPGVVVADFLSNRLRRVADGAALGWEGLRSAIEKETGMAVEIVPRVDKTGRRLKPAIAAHGASWVAITRAFSRQTPPAVPPGWGLDCANSWSELAGRIR